jgi:hypothetical protein
MRTSDGLLKHRIPAVAATLFIAGCLAAVTSLAAAQDTPANVATAQRETLLQTHDSKGDARGAYLAPMALPSHAECGIRPLRNSDTARSGEW